MRRVLVIGFSSSVVVSPEDCSEELEIPSLCTLRKPAINAKRVAWAVTSTFGDTRLARWGAVWVWR